MSHHGHHPAGDGVEQTEPEASGPEVMVPGPVSAAELMPDSESSPPAVTISAPASEPQIEHENYLFHDILTGNLADTVRNSISTLAKGKGKATERDKDAVSDRVCSSAVEVNDDKGKEQQQHYLQPPPKRTLHLLSLPAEIQIMILRFLEFADIERLRRTCKALRALANPAQIRSIMGPILLRMQLLGHCRTCLLRDPFRSHLLLGKPSDPGYPLASKCINCAIAANDDRIRVGKKVLLASLDQVWVCRWCGWPVTEGASSGNEQFHRPCYKSYNDALFVFFVLGWLQLGLGVTGAALSWRYFRHAKLIFGPTVTSFLLLWVCLGFLIFRGNRRRTYHYTLVLELAILCLWIPPVYDIASSIAAAPGAAVPKTTQATLAMYALNMFFRLMNVFGNIILLSKYDMTRSHRPTASLWRRMFHSVAAPLIFWTYPQSLEQRYPAESVAPVTTPPRFHP